MPNNIVTMVPKRNFLGRYTTTRQQVRKFLLKTLWVLIVLNSFALNLLQASQRYNITCSEPMGLFPTKEACDERVSDRMAAQEVDRQAFMLANEDLFN